MCSSDLVYYFHRISFTGLSANLIVAPLMEAVVPIGFAALFSQWHWLALLAGGMVRISARVADWHAALEPSWRLADPPLWIAMAFGASVLACLLWRRAWPAPLLVFAILVWQPWPQPSLTGELEMTAIDVGQGDSILVTLPRGEALLVDAGGLVQIGRAHV